VRFREKFLLGLAVAGAVSLLAAALLGQQGWREVHRLRGERAVLAEDLARLRAQRDGLERDIASLRENPRAIEARARRDLGMIREGETVFLLPERNGPER